MSRSNAPAHRPGQILSGAAILGGEEPESPPQSPHQHPPDKDLPLALPSGRRVALSLDAEGEKIQVHAPDGEVEVSILLTAEGPVVRLKGARLELESTEKVAVKCKDFEVQAESAIDLRCREDMHVKSEKDVFVEGAVVWLN